MRFEDYYQTMGLKPGAAASEIKQAYRRLARLYHPDLNKSAQAHASMAQVNEAYEVLSHPQRRAAYDGVRERRNALSIAASKARAEKPADPSVDAADATEKGELPGDWKQGFSFEGAPTAGRSGEQGFSDFFTSMFGRAAKPEPADAKPERGSDAHVRLTIDAADAVNGAVRSVSVRTLAPDDKGHRAVVQRQIQVQIPKGTKAGQYVRLPGQGSAGRGGAVAGDLYLEIQFKQEDAPGQSRDVHKPLPLAPWEAALGAEVAATTPGGEVSVSVPPDTPHGKRLRLKGRGLGGQTNGEPAGDMVLEVAVMLPASTLPGARAAYNAMEAILGKDFKPRAGAAGR